MKEYEKSTSLCNPAPPLAQLAHRPSSGTLETGTSQNWAKAAGRPWLVNRFGSVGSFGGRWTHGDPSLFGKIRDTEVWFMRKARDFGTHPETRRRKQPLLTGATATLQLSNAVNVLELSFPLACRFFNCNSESCLKSWCQGQTRFLSLAAPLKKR